MVSYGESDNGDCKQYATRMYQKLVADATFEEVRGDDQFTSRSYQKLSTPATTEATQVPAEYENRTYQKLVADASFEENTTPSEYVDRSYQKLATAASTTATPVEAKFASRTYTVTSAPTVENVEAPAQYKTITRRQLVKPGGFTEWKEVVCDADITVDLYRRVQQALLDRGYDIGSAGVDGKVGASTKAALVKFQKDNGLPIGSLDFETLRALGVK